MDSYIPYPEVSWFFIKSFKTIGRMAQMKVRHSVLDISRIKQFIYDWYTWGFLPPTCILQDAVMACFSNWSVMSHNDVIKWKHFPRYWPFVRGIHRSQVNSPHKGQWRGALMFSLICAWIDCCVNNREAGDLRRRRANYDVIVFKCR